MYIFWYNFLLINIRYTVFMDVEDPCRQACTRADSVYLRSPLRSWHGGGSESHCFQNTDIAVLLQQRWCLLWTRACARQGYAAFLFSRRNTPSMYGRRIRIVGDKLDGYEGSLITISGSRVKCLFVALPRLLAVGVEVNLEYVKVWGEWYNKVKDTISAFATYRWI